MSMASLVIFCSHTTKPVSLEYTHGVIPNFTPVKCCKNLEMPWGALGLCLLTYLPALLLLQFYIQLLYITNVLEFEFQPSLTQKSVCFAHENATPQKQDNIGKVYFTALIAQKGLSIRIIVLNLAYRLTVYKTGAFTGWAPGQLYQKRTLLTS